ncbi:MAG: hypothetical protein ACR2NW_00545 [Thermodesulfobacteriota bacterium]
MNLASSVNQQGNFFVNFIGNLGKCPYKLAAYKFVWLDPAPVKPGDIFKLAVC